MPPELRARSSSDTFVEHMPGKVHVIDHPLVQHKLTLMRSKETSTSTFRNLLREISMLLAYEVCRDLPTTNIQIDTPLAPTTAPVLDGKKIVLISILRAMHDRKYDEFVFVQFMHDDVRQPFYDPFTRVGSAADVSDAWKFR